MADQFFILFVFSITLSLFFTPLIRRFARNHGLVDDINDKRKIHRGVIPRVGGIAFYMSFIICCLFIIIYHRFDPISIPINVADFIKIIIICSGAFIIGLLDDIFKVRAGIKFLSQGILAVVAYFIGFKITMMTFPFGDHVLQFGLLSLPVTVLWYIGITNAFNLIDGIDGLAAGLGIIASAVLFVVSVTSGHIVEAYITLILAGALLGFLRYNFHPASIFMGDSGSLFIGFLLALVGITSSQKASTAIVIFTPFLVLAVPIIDTSISFFRRIISGKPIFHGDREHIHHKLLDMGFNQKKVAFILYGAGAFLGFYSLFFVNAGSRYIGYSFIVIFLILILGIKKIGYDEFIEFVRYVILGFPKQGRKLSKHIQLRKAFNNGLFTNTNGNPEQMFVVLRDLLEEFGFDKVDLKVIEKNGVTEKQLDTFSWTREGIKETELCSLITLPIIFNDSGTAFLTILNYDIQKKIDVRFALIFEDLPVYLSNVLSKVYSNGG